MENTATAVKLTETAEARAIREDMNNRLAEIVASLAGQLMSEGMDDDAAFEAATNIALQRLIDQAPEVALKMMLGTFLAGTGELVVR